MPLGVGDQAPGSIGEGESITGLEVIALQALEQFVLYTGVRPTPEQVEAAVAYARDI